MPVEPRVKMRVAFASTARCRLSRLALAACLLASAALAEDRTLWQIGKFDQSSGGFRSEGIDYASPNSDPVFVIGQNKDADWYRFQPGPANGMTGARLHPFRLRFNLNDTPRGVFRLTIAMLYETPRLSALRLQVNGHAGLFYFHPRLDYAAGDWEGTFVPQTSTDTKIIELPAAWLKRGSNEFVLIAVDDPPTPQSSLGAIAPGHTGLVYDALKLTNDPASSPTAKCSAMVEPTIFYRQTTSGLAEVVDIFASCAHMPQRGSISLTIQGQTQTKQFTGNEDFGERRVAFDVPEWNGTVNARVRLGGATIKASATVAKKWIVAVIPHEHLDIGFTDYPAKVAELHSQSIDGAMKLMEKTPDFRWTLDGSWVAGQYLAARSAESRNRFLEAVRNGQVVIPPQMASQHTGNASWEGLARSFYGTRRLEREYNLPRQDAAQIVDVPSYPWAYASVLHNAGIKYFIAASNSWRAPVMLLGRWNEKSPFYWEGPDGGRVLMWYSRAYLQMHTLFGSPWRMESVRDALPVFLQAYTRPDYTANTAVIFGSQLENTPLAKEQAEIVGAIKREYAYPKFEFATVHSAMAQIEREWKGAIPVVRSDFGPYWEDGYGSDAAHAAIHRENQHRITTAEVLGSAVHAVDPTVQADRAVLNDAWRNELLYDEHTWTYVGATAQPEHHQTTEQLALKQARVGRARNDISESIHLGWAQLEAMVAPRENSIAVFNPLNWKRSGIVETDFAAGNSLVDSTTGEAVPVDVLWKGKGIPLPGFGPGNVRIRFEANDVPAVGYKLYTIKISLAAQGPVQGTSAEVFENQFYRIRLDAASGAIASIFDKQLGRELVDTKSPYRFGSYVYVTGADDYPNNSLYRFGRGLNPPTLTPHQASNGKIVSVVKAPYGTVATLQSASVNTPQITTEVTLYDSEKKIGLVLHLHKERVLSRESAYVAFPFAPDSPGFAYGAQTGWIDPAKDELPGGSREWYVASTWAAVRNPQLTAAIVPIDAPLVTFGDIVRGAWPAEFKPASSAIFSWLMNNYWGTNFPAWQGGDFTFRYEITSSSTFAAPELTRFALNALTPLERDDVGASNEPSSLPATQASLLQIDSPAATLLTWKQAEDGDGAILRLQESFGEATTAHLRSDYFTFDRAWLCSAVEDNESELPAAAGDLSVALKPFQVVTVRVRTSARQRGVSR